MLHYLKLQSIRFFFTGPSWKHVYPLIKIASDTACFFKSQGRKLDIFNCTLVFHKEIPSSKPRANNELLTVPVEKLHLTVVVFSFFLNIKMKKAKVSRIHRNDHREFFFPFQCVSKKLSLKHKRLLSAKLLTC